MPNPIPYNQLFDIDGLNAAIVDCQSATDSFEKSATADFEAINAIVLKLKGQLADVKSLLANPIKLMDDAGQQQVMALSNQVANLTKQYNEQQAAINALNTALKSNQKAISDAKVAAAEYDAELKRGKVDEQDIKVRIADHSLALKELALANRMATGEARAALGPYKELSAQLTKMRNEAKDLAVTHGLNSPEFTAAATNVNALDGRLKEIDQTLGQSQRNVGNYTSVFGKLFGYIRTAAYILPGIGIAGIFSLIGEAFISLITKLNILNPLLSQTELKFQALGKAVADKSYSDAIENIEKLRINIDLAKNGFIDQGKVVDQYNETLGKTVGAVDTLNDAEKKLNENATAFINITRLKAAAQLSLADAATATYETEQKNIKIQQDITDAQNNTLTLKGFLNGGFNLGNAQSENQAKRIADDNKQIADNNKKLASDLNNRLTIARDFYKQIADISKKSGFSNGLTPDGNNISAEMQLQNDLVTKLLDIDQQAQQKIIDNNKKSYAARLAASSKYQEDSIGKAKIAQDLALAQENLSGNQIAKINLDFDQAKTEAENAGIKQRQDLRDKASAQDLQHLKNTLQAQKDAAKLIIDNPASSLDKKQGALDSSYSASTGIINATYDEQVKQAGNVKEALILAKDEQNKALLQLDIDYQNQSNKILEDTYNEQINAARDADKRLMVEIEQAITNLKSYSAQAVQQLDKDRSDVLLALAKQYQSGKINEQKYNEDLRNIDNQYNESKIQAELKTAEAVLDIRKQLAGTSKENEKAYKDALAQVDALKLALQNLGIKVISDDTKTAIDHLNELVSILEKSAQTVSNATGSKGLGSLFSDLNKDLVKGIPAADTLKESLGLAMDAISTYTDFAIMASNARIEQLNKERDHDLALAGNNAEAKTAIEEEYNRKITEEKTKQARLQRTQALIQIAINTAVAVSAATTTGPLGFFLIPAIIALGLLEAGIVASQPLPQYAKGRNGGDAELAEVNERGPELIGQRGKWRLANRGMRGVTFLNKGDEVKTATDTKQMLANGMITRDGQYVTNVSQSKSIYDQYIMATSRANNIDYGLMAEAVADGVSGLPITEHNFNERGYQQSLRVKNTRMIDINRRNRF